MEEEKIHITEATGTIEERKEEVEEDNKFFYSYDHTTSGVSCNGQGGGASSACSFEKAVEGIRKAIKQHNIWCDSWEDKKGISYRLNEKYKTKLLINGKKYPLENDSLLAFCEG